MTSWKRWLRPANRSRALFVAGALTPVMLLFFVFFILPITASVVLAFYRYSPLDPDSPFIGVRNFLNLVSDPVFRKAVRNTFYFVLAAVPVNLLITLPIAIGLDGVRRRWLRDSLRAVYFLPTVAPIVAAAVIWAYLYQPVNGLLNAFIGHLGIPRILWLTSAKWAMPSVIVMSLWQDIGYNIVIFLAGLEAIPSVFYEAAKIDGAGRWHLFRNITFPLLSRTSSFVLVMTMISYLQVFAQMQVMTNGGPHDSTRVLALFIYDSAFRYNQMGYASAAAVILLGVTLLLTLLALWLTRRMSQWEY